MYNTKQSAPQDRWKQGKSDGWYLKATAIKQLKVGWIVGLFSFHLKGSSERHSLSQGGDQVKLEASFDSRSWMACLLSPSFSSIPSIPYSV
jgi:hypothetical protein